MESHEKRAHHALQISVSDRALTFKEVSLNYGNLDLFKEIFEKIYFLRKF